MSMGYRTAPPRAPTRSVSMHVPRVMYRKQAFSIQIDVSEGASSPCQGQLGSWLVALRAGSDSALSCGYESNMHSDVPPSLPVCRQSCGLIRLFALGRSNVSGQVKGEELYVRCLQLNAAGRDKAR